MIDPNNLTTHDAREALLHVLTRLEDAEMIRGLRVSDPDERPIIERIAKTYDLGFVNLDDVRDDHADEMADEIIEGAFLAVDPTGFRANGWEPDPTSLLGIEYTITVGGPNVWVESKLDDRGSVESLVASVAWGAGRVDWEAPSDIRARWEDVDPARAFIESIA